MTEWLPWRGPWNCICAGTCLEADAGYAALPLEEVCCSRPDWSMRFEVDRRRRVGKKSSDRPNRAHGCVITVAHSYAINLHRRRKATLQSAAVVRHGHFSATPWAAQFKEVFGKLVPVHPLHLCQAITPSTDQSCTQHPCASQSVAVRYTSVGRVSKFF